MGRLLSASVPCSGPGKRWCWNERVVSLEQNIRLLIEQRKLANYVKIWLVCLCSVAFAWITGDQIIYALLQITELLFFLKAWKILRDLFHSFLPWNQLTLLSSFSPACLYSRLVVSGALPSHKHPMLILSLWFHICSVSFPGQIPVIYFFDHFIFHLSPFLWSPSIHPITQINKREKNIF